MVRGNSVQCSMQVAIMKKIKCIAKLYLYDTGGATAIEYGLIAAAMGLMLIPVMVTLTSTVQSTMFDRVAGFFAGYT